MKLQKHRRKAEINIVPLIDVLIVLIFFFLMTMQFRNMNVLMITPPKMETAGKSTNLEQIVVGISPEGVFYVNNAITSETGIQTIFAEAAQQDPQPSILVLADKNTYLKYFTFIIDESRQANLTKIRLQTR